MDPEQAEAAPGMPESRTGAFNTGLAQDSQRYNDLVPKTVTPHSVLQPVRPSTNGMSTADGNRMMPGGMMLPSKNGTSAGTWEQSAMLRMMNRE